MKYLGERIPATFAHARVDVDGSASLTGARGRQIAGRFNLLRHTPLPYGTRVHKDTWADLVGDMEGARCACVDIGRALWSDTRSR